MATSRMAKALLKLTADPSEAKHALEQVSTQLKGLDKLSPEARIRIRDEGAKAQLDKLNKRLHALDAQEVTPNIQIAKANIERQISRIEGRLKDVGGANHDLVKSNARVRTSFGNVWAHGGAAFAAVGGAYAIKTALESVITAYGESQKSQARVRAQLKALGIDYKAHAGQIDGVIQKTSQLAGLDDEDLQDAFTNIVRTTGNVSKALNLVGLAADLARAKHLDVAKAGDLVAKVAGGNVGILSRYGITIDKNATSTEALATLQKKFGGQAEAYGKTQAGASDRASVAFENLREVIGKKLSPTLTKVFNYLADFVNQMVDGTGKGGKFVDKLKDIANGVGDVLGPIKDAAVATAEWVDKHDNVKKLAEALVAVGLAVKGIKFASKVTGLDNLLGGLRRLSKTKAGEKAAESIASGLTGGGKKIRGVLRSIFSRGGSAAGAKAAEGVAGDLASNLGPNLNSKRGRIRTLFQRLFHRFGSSGGSAAADFAAGSLYANMGPQLDKRRGKLRKVFAAFGRTLGRFLGLAAGVTAAVLIQEKLNEALGQAGKKSREDPSNPFSRTPGYTDPGESAADKIRHLLGFSSGGLVPGAGHRDTVPSMLTPGEFVVRRNAVQAVGLGNLQRLNAGGGGGAMQQTNHWHVTAPSPDYVASRWEHRTADAMRRRGRMVPGY